MKDGLLVHKLCHFSSEVRCDHAAMTSTKLMGGGEALDRFYRSWQRWGAVMEESIPMLEEACEERSHTTMPYPHLLRTLRVRH